MPLRRARDVQWPAHAEELAREIKMMHLTGIGKQPAGFVIAHRAVFPRVPQLSDHINKLTGALVAAAVLRQVVKAEVRRFLLQP